MFALILIRTIKVDIPGTNALKKDNIIKFNNYKVRYVPNFIVS